MDEKRGEIKAIPYELWPLFPCRMEACPKLPMIHFDLKFSPDNGDFAHKMKQLIHVRIGHVLYQLFLRSQTRNLQRFLMSSEQIDRSTEKDRDIQLL